MKSHLVFVDLFSGVGGLTYGFKLAGFRPVFALDFDYDAMKIYIRNNPEVNYIVKDIRKVSVREIFERGQFSKGDVDVIVGGVPCEGYSLLNRRYNPTDPRNYLFLEFLRIVREVRPNAVLIENVPGLARRKNGSFKEAIEKALEKLGYKVNSFVLLATKYGVPQKRQRIFFVGVDGHERVDPPSPIEHALLLPEDSDTFTVWDAISDLPPLKSGEKKTDYESPPKSEYQKIMRKGAKKLTSHVAPKHPEWTIERIKNTPPGHPIYKTFKQRIRLSWNEPAPTIPAGGIRPQWFFAHPEQPRGLTVREMARLQSFPDKYLLDEVSIVKQRVLVGDAVPPFLAYALAKKLLEYL
ncbi:DNA cytosine methyltransferase [Thermococcus sp. 9N3]|uniref:DNA cytosine methyltransferase n=1 Tax=Thermococcus sp. 9N3 TaxID=163002 RepID=UPI00142F679C|nr:DNA cytosine methyltransferase [Thermococcus sp. 9N3]NJE50076.1 DNA cytosine methyltransferase [Thermococcus sp. 9N3]